MQLTFVGQTQRETWQKKLQKITQRKQKICRVCEVSEPRRHFVDVVVRQSLFSFQNKHTPTQTHTHCHTHPERETRVTAWVILSQSLSLFSHSQTLSLSHSLSLLNATIKIATFSNDSCTHCSFIFTFTTIPIESPSLSGRVSAFAWPV